MAIVAYPGNPKHQRVELQPLVGALVNRSELTKARQAVDMGYSWWEASVDVAPMTLDDARAWRLFTGRIRGPVHSFRLPVMSRPQHNGSFTVQARGVGSGYTLTTDGWPAASLVLLGGEYVTVGDQLMLLDADVNTSASGIATLQFHSPLRRIVADDTAIETKNPWLLSAFAESAPALALTTAQLQDGFSFAVGEAY